MFSLVMLRSICCWSRSYISMSLTSSVEIKNLPKEQVIDEVLIFNEALEIFDQNTSTTSNAADTFDPFDLNQYPRSSSPLCGRVISEDFETDEENIDYAIFCDRVKKPFTKIYPRGSTKTCSPDFVCGNLVDEVLQQKLHLKRLIEEYTGPNHVYFYGEDYADNVETLQKVYDVLKKQSLDESDKTVLVLPENHYSSPSVLKRIYEWLDDQDSFELNRTEYVPMPMPEGYSNRSFLEMSDSELDKNIFLSVSQRDYSPPDVWKTALTSGQFYQTQAPLPIGYRKDGTQVRSAVERNNNLEYQPMLKPVSDGFLPIFLPDVCSIMW